MPQQGLYSTVSDLHELITGLKVCCSSSRTRCLPRIVRDWHARRDVGVGAQVRGIYTIVSRLDVSMV
jgi:hypothetical protein